LLDAQCGMGLGGMHSMLESRYDYGLAGSGLALVFELQSKNRNGHGTRWRERFSNIVVLPVHNARGVMSWMNAAKASFDAHLPCPRVLYR
jgi:hypothetical protein